MRAVAFSFVYYITKIRFFAKSNIVIHLWVWTWSLSFNNCLVSFLLLAINFQHILFYPVLAHVLLLLLHQEFLVHSAHFQDTLGVIGAQASRVVLDCRWVSQVQLGICGFDEFGQSRDWISCSLVYLALVVAHISLGLYHWRGFGWCWNYFDDNIQRFDESPSRFSNFLVSCEFLELYSSLLIIPVILFYRHFFPRSRFAFRGSAWPIWVDATV